MLWMLAKKIINLWKHAVWTETSFLETELLYLKYKCILIRYFELNSNARNSKSATQNWICNFANGRFARLFTPSPRCLNVFTFTGFSPLGSVSPWPWKLQIFRETVLSISKPTFQFIRNCWIVADNGLSVYNAAIAIDTILLFQH